jgi:signal transduction histidine kinase
MFQKMSGTPGKIKLSVPLARTQHDSMKPKNLLRLSQQYETALEKHLKLGPGAALQPASTIGRAALRLGLDTLDLARMHEEALFTLGLADKKNAFTKLAGIFFNEANAQIESTHRAAQQGRASLSRAQAALDVRTEELAASNQEVRRGIARHKTLADTAVTNGQDYQKSLKESLQLQRLLRKLTHRVMLEQENDRKNISHELQDEIAQTLLGINVRLLSLKEHARSNTKGLKSEIASTQRLVLESAGTVRRFARELTNQMPA